MIFWYILIVCLAFMVVGLVIWNILLYTKQRDMQFEIDKLTRGSNYMGTNFARTAARMAAIQLYVREHKGQKFDTVFHDIFDAFQDPKAWRVIDK